MTALTFPLSLAEFQDKIKISVAQMDPYEPRQIDRTGSGSVLSASLGDAIWRGSFQMPPTNNAAEAGERDALLSLLDRAGASFLVYDPRRPHPACDPDGSMLGLTTPVIAALEDNNRQLSVSGLPGGYQLAPGDLIGWQYGSDPVRYALHRIVVGSTANNSGATSLFEVTPFIAPETVTGTAVTLSKPVIKAVLEPNPTYGAGRAVITDGPRFSFVQTLR